MEGEDDWEVGADMIGGVFSALLLDSTPEWKRMTLSTRALEGESIHRISCAIIGVHVLDNIVLNIWSWFQIK